MNDAEIKKLLYVAKAAYPAAYQKYSAADYENLLIAWKMCLGDYTYEQASKGLMAFMRSDTKGFPPVAGQIIEQIQKLTPAAEQMGAMEAWALVYKAISNSLYNYEKEYAKLPPLVQKAVGHPANLREMAMMDMNTVNSVEQSHFIRQYNAYVEREKEMQKLPVGMRIGQQERMMLNGWNK